MPDDAVDLLVPRPRTVRTAHDRADDAVLCSDRSPMLRCLGPEAGIAPARTRVERMLAGLGMSAHGDAASRDGVTIELALGEGAASDESYRLRIARGRIRLEASAPVGLFRAATTLAQWLAIHRTGDERPTTMPALEVDDAPDLRERGVMLDVSRDKVPTLETLFDLVDRLADVRVNQLQLYIEHTFAYAGHEPVWRDASPFTANEIRRLDEHCRSRFIALVPNQNSFGHFHRWLVHEPYRRLAECPDGVEHPFSRGKEPFSLCPIDPRSAALLGDLYDQLLPCFSSHELNVGLDETLDLGLGRSAEACRVRGKTTVYLDFVRQVHRLAASRGFRIQMWGDIVLQQPERLDEIPDDVTVLAWGYEGDHPFAEEARRFAAAERRFLLCPGTSSWLSFAGRIDNMLENVRGAAHAAREAGAAGLLNTDWGDRGHLQPLPVSLPGLFAGAQAAWNVDASRDLDAQRLGRQLAVHVFDGDHGLADALIRLGNVYRLAGTPARNGSPLFHLVLSPEDDLRHVRYRGLNAPGLADVRAEVAAARDLLAGTTGQARVVDELSWVADLLDLGALVGLARLDAGLDVDVGGLPPAVRRDLDQRLDAVLETHRKVWRLRNRPGGRADSAARFEPLRAALVV